MRKSQLLPEYKPSFGKKRTFSDVPCTQRQLRVVSRRIYCYAIDSIDVRTGGGSDKNLESRSNTETYETYGGRRVVSVRHQFQSFVGFGTCGKIILDGRFEIRD